MLINKTTFLCDKSSYYIVMDMSDLSLGRNCSIIASLLQGKFSDCYSSNVDYKVNIFLDNCSQTFLLGKKEKTKKWFRHKDRNLKFNVFSHENALKLIKQSVSRMLPKNRLRKNP